MLELFAIIYNIILPIMAAIGLGAWLGRRFDPDPRTLSRAVVFIFAPFLVMDGISHSTLPVGEMGRLVALVLLFAVTMASLSWLLARLLGFDRQLESSFIMSAVLMNSGNYGLPISEFAFGAAGLQWAILFYVIMTVVTNTLGVFLASRSKGSVRQAVKNVLTVPLLYAAIFGLLLNQSDFAIPVPLERLMRLLGQAAVPSMLIILGLQLARLRIQKQWGPITLATGVRLLLGPLIAWPLASLLGLTGLAWQIAILQASMPTAVIAGVLATEFGSDAEFATAVIMVSTLLSTVTLTVLLYLL